MVLPGVLAHTSHPGTQETEARRIESSGPFWVNVRLSKGKEEERKGGEREGRTKKKDLLILCNCPITVEMNPRGPWVWWTAVLQAW